MEQEIEIEVLVAGPEHEQYVDTILDTIAEAAKVDSPDERWSFCRIQLYRDMGEPAVCDHLRTDCTPRLQGAPRSQAHQRHDLHFGPYPLATRQDFLPDERCCRDGNEHSLGLPARDLRRPH